MTYRNVKHYRHTVHLYLDSIWPISSNPKKARTTMYKWLANQMGMDYYKCHVKWFTRDQCRQAIKILRQKQIQLYGKDLVYERWKECMEETKRKISKAMKGGNYMETAMTVKIYKIDYSFLIKNYLNPELWKKEWTLFAYKNIECTLQIYSIQTVDEKIRFQIRCYSHNLESTDLNNYCTNYIDCSLKIEDITFLKRQINSCIFNTMVLLERIYYIRKTEEYEDMEERRYEERYRLKQYANEFLNECGVTSDACREAYVDAYVDENERMYDLMNDWEEQQVYRHLTGMYLTFLDTLEDDPKKEIRTNEIKHRLSNKELQDVQDEIKDFVIFMEDEENFEKELKSKLEEV